MGIEARGHTTSYRHEGTTLRRTSTDVIMAVNGLKPVPSRQRGRNGTDVIRNYRCETV